MTTISLKDFDWEMPPPGTITSDTGETAVPGSCPFISAEDPHQIDSSGTMVFMQTFFAHSPSGLGNMFPPRLFADWVQGSLIKTGEECGTLYALLCLGSIHAPVDSMPFAKLCHRRAGQYICRVDDRDGMPFAQACMLFAVYLSLHGEVLQSWEAACSAFEIIGKFDWAVNKASHKTTRERGAHYGLTMEEWIHCCARSYMVAVHMAVSSRISTCIVVY